MFLCLFQWFLVRFVGYDTGARAEGDPQVKNTLKQRIWGKMLVRTWRCLKAAVSWVMCRVRHLDVHLALFVFSWTSSCSGELLRAQVTANIAQSSTKPARRPDITPEANTKTYTTTTKRFFPLVSSCFEGVLLSLTYKFRMKTSERRSCLRASREWSASADTPTTGTSAATWSYNVLHPHYPKYRHHPRQRRAQAAIITIAAASSDDQASGMRASSLSLRFFLFNFTVFASFVFIKLTSNPQRHHTHQLLVL